MEIIEAQGSNFIQQWLSESPLQVRERNATGVCEQLVRPGDRCSLCLGQCGKEPFCLRDGISSKQVAVEVQAFALCFLGVDEANVDDVAENVLRVAYAEVVAAAFDRFAV